MPIYLGTQQVNGIWLGADEVVNVWKGTDLIYTKGTPGPAESVLFDHGWISGIPWSGNLLTRPQYTSLGGYSFSNVDAYGYMNIYIASQVGYAAVNHNAHVCTTNLITVPSGATKMCVRVRRSSGTSIYINWGVLPDNAPNSMDTSAGGQLSGIYELSSDATTTLELTLSAGIAGGQYRAIVNCRSRGDYDGTRSIDIFKFWFE